jgi:hypothetical protein
VVLKGRKEREREGGGEREEGREGEREGREEEREYQTSETC